MGIDRTPIIETLKRSLWNHFGGSINMFGNAIKMWPEEYWYAEPKFFYIAYHCLVFLDYYLTIPPTGFSAQLPYTLKEPVEIPTDAIDDVVPDSIYTKEELLGYLRSSREKCRQVIAGLTESKLNEQWIGGATSPDLELSGAEAMHYSVLDILFYNLKHVQHHTAQLNLLLRQRINNATPYISMAKDQL